MSRRLEGKVAIITGAGTGIGEAIAHKFAKEGAKAIVTGLPDAPTGDVAQSIQQYGGEAIAYGLQMAASPLLKVPLVRHPSRCVNSQKANYASITPKRS